MQKIPDTTMKFFLKNTRFGDLHFGEVAYAGETDEENFFHNIKKSLATLQTMPAITGHN